MGTITKNIQWVIIIFLMLVVFLQRECHRCPDCPELPKPDTITYYDTVQITTEPIKPKPGRVEYIVIPTTIDTFAIIRDYFSRRYGEDTLINNRDLFLSLRWEMKENRPTLFKPTIINRIPTTVITHTPARKIDIYAGAVMRGNVRSFGFAPTVLLRWDNATYSLGYDVMHREVNGGLFWRIR